MNYPSESPSIRSWTAHGAAYRANRQRGADEVSEARTAAAEQVALVGAGPGDPELLTLRAARLLAAADVVLYDNLVGDGILELCSRDARLIDVGKIPGKKATAQEVIHGLLIREARAGQRVVRLKGGDPFVFGRGGEEALALRRAGVDFVVVPGISSSISVPQAAGIPVTHRGVATHFSVITGRGASADGRPLEESWAQLAKAGGTMVFLMGVGKLERIVEVVLQAGRAATTPAALVCAGTTEAQHTIEGTLQDIVARVRESGARPPGILVIGEVVGLRAEIAEIAAEELRTEEATGEEHGRHRIAVG